MAKRSAHLPTDLTEHQLELAVCHYMHSQKLCFWKQPSAGYFDSKTQRFRKHSNPFVGVGVPDIIWIFKGLFIGLELKVGKNRLSEAQKDMHERIQNQGNGLVYVIRSLDDAINLIKHLNSNLPC